MPGGGGRGHSLFPKASLGVQLPLFRPIFSESGIVFSVHDLIWPGIICQIFWPPFTDLQKLKNWKSLAHQMKAKDSSIIMKICPDKREVKWLTFIDLWWPQNLASWNICMMYIKRKMSTQGYNMWQPFFSVLDYLTSHDHDLTSYDLFWPFDLKNSYYYC